MIAKHTQTTIKPMTAPVALRRLVLGAVLAPLVFVLCLAYTVPAQAAVGHELSSSFGAGMLSNPTDVTVDQATGNVYVTNSGSNTVAVFGPEGGSPVGLAEPVAPGGPVVLTGAGAPNEFHFGGEPSQVAIDETNNDLYVSDAENGVVDKFVLNAVTKKYEYECQFSGPARECLKEPGAAPEWFEPDGAAVDPQGDVYVASFGPHIGSNQGSVSEFGPEGKPKRKLEGGDIGVDSGPVGVAVDSVTGDIYVNDFHRSVFRIEEPSGQESFLDRNSASSVATDSHGDVFVTESSEQSSALNVRVAEFGPVPTNEELDNFGEGQISKTEGVAANTTKEWVYVTDKQAQEVKIFVQVVVPAVQTLGSSSVKGGSAVLHGKINPEGKTAEYYFEYGPCRRNRPSECDISPYPQKTTPEPAGSGTSIVEKESEATELIPETLYHYRMVGVNANGEKRAKEQTFMTGPATPGVHTGGVLELHPTSAMLGGELDPEGAFTFYRFEYADSEEYNNPAFTSPYTQSSSYTFTEGASEENITVELAGLRPGTTYHYRLNTVNLSLGLENGITNGEDESFTTPPEPPTVNDQTPFATGVKPTEAVLHATINPGEGLTTYHFVYGPTPSYGQSSTEATTPLNIEDDAVQALITGLAPDTTYHYALVASNASGTVQGPDQTFTTLPVEPSGEQTTTPNGQPLPITGLQGITQPSTLPLLSFAPIVFPTEPNGSTSTTSTPKTLTKAQKLARALKACRKQSKKSRRAACERKAHKKYGK